MSHVEKCSAPIFCFTANVYKTGRPGFWIPADIKAEMGWVNPDYRLGFVIFDEAGTTIWQGVHETVSGGEFYQPDALAFRNATTVQVAVYWPPVMNL